MKILLKKTTKMCIYMFVSAFIVVVFGLFGQCLSVTEASATEEFTLPVTTCKRDSSDYSTCLKSALEEAWPRFIEGFPEVDFPPLDPLLFKYHKAVYNNGELHAEIIMTNLTIVGYKTSQFFNVRPHFLDETFRLEIDFYIPLMRIDGHVKGGGRLNVFTINGEGPFNLILDGITTGWDLHGYIENDTWIVEHFYISRGTTVNKVKLDFHHLFQGKELNDLVLDFINTYWPPLYRVVLPVTVESIDPLFTNITNKIFSKVPFSKVFP